MALSAIEPTTDDQAEPRTEWVDDYLIDLETGEIIATREPAFRVYSIGSAEWVLDRIGRREAAIGALRARREAIINNLEAMIKAEQRRLDGLHYRFDGELESFARAELERTGGRTKTLRTAFGSVSFRIVKASRKIVDMTAAVAWAKDWMPEIVRVKEDVLLSDLYADPDDPRVILIQEPWLERRPEEERCYVRTGLEEAS